MRKIYIPTVFLLVVCSFVFVSCEYLSDEISWEYRGLWEVEYVQHFGPLPYTDAALPEKNVNTAGYNIGSSQIRIMRNGESLGTIYRVSTSDKGEFLYDSNPDLTITELSSTGYWMTIDPNDSNKATMYTSMHNQFGATGLYHPETSTGIERLKKVHRFSWSTP